ncbi:MAG TPA: hypothetical protein VHY09_05515 [Candidatus Methylacidiphilales bacterium]|nr:hypothetical protein [Candidatus Methylacidiphilales bacterium]
MQRPFLLAIWVLLLIVTSAVARADLDPALREQGVLYFEGNLPERVNATIHTTTTLYLHRDFQLPLAALYNGQKVEIIGMAPEGYLLTATVRNNTATGWIKPNDLPSGIDPAVFVTAQKNQARRDAVAVAIANKNVIQGMTPDEVKLAVGAPTSVASKSDPHGDALTWIYTTYREDPQYEYTIDAFGHPIMQTYYVKVPIGQMIIQFDNGTVYSIEQHKTDPNNPGIVTN